MMWSLFKTNECCYSCWYHKIDSTYGDCYCFKEPCEFKPMLFGFIPQTFFQVVLIIALSWGVIGLIWGVALIAEKVFC